MKISKTIQLVQKMMNQELAHSNIVDESCPFSNEFQGRHFIASNGNAKAFYSSCFNSKVFPESKMTVSFIVGTPNDIQNEKKYEIEGDDIFIPVYDGSEISLFMMREKIEFKDLLEIIVKYKNENFKEILEHCE